MLRHVHELVASGLPPTTLGPSALIPACHWQDMVELNHQLSLVTQPRRRPFATGLSGMGWCNSIGFSYAAF